MSADEVPVGTPLWGPVSHAGALCRALAFVEETGQPVRVRGARHDGRWEYRAVVAGPRLSR